MSYLSVNQRNKSVTKSLQSQIKFNTHLLLKLVSFSSLGVFLFLNLFNFIYFNLAPNTLAGAQSNSITTSTVSTFSGSDKDAINTSVIIPNTKKVVLGGQLSNNQNFNLTPQVINAGTTGVIALFDNTGKQLERLLRLGTVIDDMGILPNGNIVSIGDAGLYVFTPDLASVVWSRPIGSSNPLSATDDFGRRLDIGKNGYIATLSNKTIRLYNDIGTQISSQVYTDTWLSDIAIDSDKSSIYISGYNQAKGPCTDVQLAFVRAYNYTNTFKWKAYGFDQNQVGNNSRGIQDNTNNNCADTRAMRLKVSPKDNSLYLLGRADGGNSVFRWNSQKLWQADSNPIIDNSNNSSGISSGSVMHIIQLDSNSGKSLMSQVHVSRLSSGRANSMTGYGLDIDKNGEIYISGSSAASFESRDKQIIDSKNLGAYSGADGFVMQLSPTMTQKRFLSAFSGSNCPNESRSIVSEDDMIVAAGFFNQKTGTTCTGMLTNNALQSGYKGGQDSYFAVFGNITPKVVATSSSVTSNSTSTNTNTNIVIDPTWSNVIKPVASKLFSTNMYDYKDINLNNSQYLPAVKYMNAPSVRVHSMNMTNESATDTLGFLKKNTNNKLVWDRERLKLFASSIRNQRASGYNPEIIFNISKAPSDMDPFTNTADFENFMADIVRILNVEEKLNIKYFEITNELDDDFIGGSSCPNSGAYCNKPFSELTQIYNRAALAMKSIDPTIKTGGLSYQNAYANIDAFLDAGIPQNTIDFISYHRYEGLGNPTPSVATVLTRPKLLVKDLGQSFINKVTQKSPNKKIEVLHDEYNICYLYLCGFGNNNNPSNQLMTNQIGALFDGLGYVYAMEAGIDGLYTWNEKDEYYGKLSSQYVKRPSAHVLAILNQLDIKNVTFHTTTNDTNNEGSVKSLSFTTNDNKRGVIAINRSDSSKNIQIVNTQNTTYQSFKVDDSIRQDTIAQNLTTDLTTTLTDYSFNVFLFENNQINISSSAPISLSPTSSSTASSTNSSVNSVMSSNSSIISNSSTSSNSNSSISNSSNLSSDSSSSSSLTSSVSLSSLTSSLSSLSSSFSTKSSQTSTPQIVDPYICETSELTGSVDVTDPLQSTVTVKVYKTSNMNESAAPDYTYNVKPDSKGDWSVKLVGLEETEYVNIFSVTDTITGGSASGRYNFDYKKIENCDKENSVNSTINTLLKTVRSGGVEIFATVTLVSSLVISLTVLVVISFLRIKKNQSAQS
jgi:hypothetical protein